MNSEQIYKANQELIDIFGYEDLYNQLSKSLGLWQLEENLRYIAQMNDVNCFDNI